MGINGTGTGLNGMENIQGVFEHDSEPGTENKFKMAKWLQMGSAARTCDQNIPLELSSGGKEEYI